MVRKSDWTIKYFFIRNYFKNLNGSNINTNNVKNFNPFRITAFSWIQFVNDFKASNNLSDKFMSFFGSPEWSPRSN